MTDPDATDVAVAVAPEPARLMRLLAELDGSGWYPLMLALAWYLRVYAVADIEPAPAIRSLAMVRRLR